MKRAFGVVGWLLALTAAVAVVILAVNSSPSSGAVVRPAAAAVSTADAPQLTDVTVLHTYFIPTHPIVHRHYETMVGELKVFVLKYPQQFWADTYLQYLYCHIPRPGAPRICTWINDPLAQEIYTEVDLCALGTSCILRPAIRGACLGGRWRIHQHVIAVSDDGKPENKWFNLPSWRGIRKSCKL